MTLAEILRDAEKAAKYIDPILSALSVVVAATGVPAPADTVLAVIRGVVDALDHVTSGRATQEETALRIGALQDIIDAHNAAADAALHAKFPKVQT